jgi:hypothetical protein
MVLGCCAGLLGLFVLSVFVHGPMTEQWGNRYFAVCASAGAIVVAICGLRYGTKLIAGQVNERFFHPGGMLLGALGAGMIGAAFAWRFVYSPHPDDSRSSIIVISVFIVLGALGGAFVGRTGWRIIGGAMLGWLVVGILSVFATRHIKGMLYGALFGAPLGAILALVAAVHAYKVNPSKSRMPSPERSGVWDAEFDPPACEQPSS